MIEKIYYKLSVSNGSVNAQKKNTYKRNKTFLLSLDFVADSSRFS